MADQYPPPVAELRALGKETVVLPVGSILWRVHFTSSTFVTPWNKLRTWGPVVNARWEPHPLPEADHAPLGAAYFGDDVLTCLAEVFQQTRFVDVDRDDPYVTALKTTRDVQLVDLQGLWLTRAGASAQIALQNKDRTCAWARAIHEAWPDVDGVRAPSAMAGGRPVTTLWTDHPLPAAPEFSMPLKSPAVLRDIVAAAGVIGYQCNVIL
ncbi:RES domain-containing protein [Arthrobacter terricola]|uniref:RES domain-containing protein n=1 Tax=Arthrobacter terricola TaxID=2547396 RepID=A0A4R5KTP7_9MICC|nr:RES domain-containing protein [Arthrobacter terricola]